MSTRALTEGQATAQSLASGAVGTVLLAVEQALNGSGTWHDAHAGITRATAGAVDAGPHAALFYGAPALAFVLNAANADSRPRYQDAVRLLVRHVHRIARQRLAAAGTRMASGCTAAFAEYDLFHGLTGLGALLLRTAPGSGTLAGILRYVTGLTRPRILDGQEVPGWWVAHDPDPLMPTPGGHVNLGMAHGAAGILTVLSIAAGRGIAVPGQLEAIGYLRDFFGRWRQDSAGGPWWPQWLTRDDLRAGVPAQVGPGRPSWCYGAAGIARALQLAAITVGDVPAQTAAEETLAACLTPAQLSRITGPGLCHGAGGLYMTALRAAQDAQTPAIAQRLPAVAALLAANAGAADHPGLLTGNAGTCLALEAARTATPPRSGWDACMLIT